ncbi:hypothetical protein C6497_16505 [Candidatus Poribacteria bacterium]|nr:MAG: hypothetical protein C6497_16505 [Candidatus Poribacteria bacterium]
MQTSKYSLVADNVIDAQSFLSQTLRHGDTLDVFDSEKIEKISEDIAAIAHKLITMKVADLSNQAELRTQTQTGISLTSLGLEYASKGNLDKAVRILNVNPSVKLYQIGNTLINQVREKAIDLLENAVIRPEESLSHLDIDSIRIYNHAEAKFLDELVSYNSTISSASVILKENHPPRPFLSLADVEIIKIQLGYIEKRRDYVETLPLEDVFAIDPPLNITIDPILILTLCLMSNLTLYYQPDLHLDHDTLKDFREIIYDENTGEVRSAPRQRMLDWIVDYLKQDNRSDDLIKFAVIYWETCIQEIIDPDENIQMFLQ